MKNTLVISAFPGTGKSYISKLHSDSDLIILDSDSSKFGWIVDANGTKIRKKDWHIDYLNHIIANIGVADIIFVSSHEIVRKILVDNEVFHYVFYPSLDMKDEMVQRYVERNNSAEFINMIRHNYEKFINGIINLSNTSKYELGIQLNKGEYILDRINLDTMEVEY